MSIGTLKFLGCFKVSRDSNICVLLANIQSTCMHSAIHIISADTFVIRY